MRSLKYVALLVVVVSLSGCTTIWTYAGVRYPTATAAEQAARSNIRQSLELISKRDTPLAESALIFTPSPTWARTGVLIKRHASDDQIDYVATVLYYGYYGMAQAIQKRGIFKNVEIQQFEQTDPLSNSAFAYIIWLRLEGPNSAQWMIAPGNNVSLASPITVSPISGVGDRIEQVLHGVQEYVKSHNGNG